MTLEQYAKLVADMRRLQRRFFGGDRSVVGQAKLLERQVDRATEDILEPPAPGLFDRLEDS